MKSTSTLGKLTEMCLNFRNLTSKEPIISLGNHLGKEGLHDIFGKIRGTILSKWYN